MTNADSSRDRLDVSGGNHSAAPPIEFQHADLGTVRKVTAASAIGNATEWFDYNIYAVSTLYITHHFFPGQQGLLLSLATFAISFLMRPLGGVIWGPLGDRIGRKRVLSLTILFMAGSTFLIGLLPSYQTIGVTAPILLVVLRMIQGFSAGGEYGGAATFMAEHAPDQRRGFFGSFLEFGTLGGMALGSLVVLLGEVTVGNDAMMAWGWRVPFLLAAVLGAAGLYLRLRLQESPVFTELAQNGKDERVGGVFKSLFTTHLPQLLILAGLVVAVNVVNYTLLSYMPTYLQTEVGMKPTVSLTVMFLAQLFMMILMPFAGRISDRVGRKPVWFFSLIGLIVCAVPMYLLIAQGFWFALLGFAVLGILYIPQLSTISATFPAMFPGPVRFAGFAIAYNVSTAVFGGTAPSANQALISKLDNPLIPAFYMMAACVVGLVAAFFMKETKGASLRGTQLPETGVTPVVEEEPAGSGSR